MKSVQVFLKELYSYDIVRYTTVGAANTVVIFGLFFLFNDALGSSAIWSNRIGYTGGLICNFTLNKLWTFKSHKFSFMEIILFSAAFSISYAVQFLIFRLLMDRWSWGDGAAAFLAYPLYGLVFYVLCKYLVFREQAVTSLDKK